MSVKIYFFQLKLLSEQELDERTENTIVLLQPTTRGQSLVSSRLTLQLWSIPERLQGSLGNFRLNWKRVKPAVKLLKILSSLFLQESKLAYEQTGDQRPRAAANTAFPLLSSPQKSEIGWNSIFTVTAATAALLMVTSLLRTLVRCWLDGHQPGQTSASETPSSSPTLSVGWPGALWTRSSWELWSRK